MAKQAYVFSTLTDSVTYGNGVTIRGGANVADPRTLVTPRGHYTKVTGDQLTELDADPIFKLHKANGFITVSGSKPDEEAAASDHVTRDDAAPLTPEDLAAENAKLAGSGDADAPPAPQAPRNPRRA